MKIVLYSPQIPQNTGNIIRTCAVTGSELILVEPLGFSMNDRWLERAGLDYREKALITIIDDLEAYLETCALPFTFLSSKASKRYTEVSYEKEHLLIFGSETEGLPPLFHERWPDHFATIPMQQGVRCLNLATSAGIVVYEAWRQLAFS